MSNNGYLNNHLFKDYYSGSKEFASEIDANYETWMQEIASRIGDDLYTEIILLEAIRDLWNERLGFDTVEGMKMYLKEILDYIIEEELILKREGESRRVYKRCLDRTAIDKVIDILPSMSIVEKRITILSNIHNTTLYEIANIFCLDHREVWNTGSALKKKLLNS